MSKISFRLKTSLLLILNAYPFFSIANNNIHSLYKSVLSNIDNKTIGKLLNNEHPDGYYSTNIYINENKKETIILYYENKDGILTPRININDLIRLNIDPSFYNIPVDLNSDLLLSDYNIDFKYNFSSQSLYLTIPQKALDNKKNMLASQVLWDDGVPALFSSYSYFGKYNNQNKIEHKISFNSGANLGAWRVRSKSYYHHTDKQQQFKLYSLYAYHQLNTLLATLNVGEFRPTSRMLSTDKLIGFQLISSNLLSGNDLYMNSPIIEDIAESHAEIKVKQQGRTIYETIVPPGPFVLNDLPVIGSNELVLEIKEADGRIRKSTHYFTTMPNQLKKGRYQYNFISGYSYDRYNQFNNQNNNPIFLLGEFSYGINQKITAYGAIRKKLNSNTFFSGLSLDLGRWGGVASDISYFEHNNLLKYQLRYNKRWSNIGTSLNISSSHYQSIKSDSVSIRKSQTDNIKNSYTISLFQPIESFGTFSIGYHQNSYDKRKNDFTINTSLSSSIKKINYSIKYQYKNEKYYNDNHFSLNLNIPLTNSSHSYHWVSNQFDYHPNNKGYINSTTIGGSLLEHYRLGYSINYQRDFSHPNAGYHTSVNTQYKGRYQSYSINATKSSNNKTNLRLGINGAIVLHQSGVTLAPDLGNTFAIVNTNGIAGIKTNRSSEDTTDNNGNLILPHIIPYRKNTIGLNINSLPEFSNTKTQSKIIVPTLGAVAKINFPINRGYNVLFTSNTPIPFAANVMVFDDNNNLISSDSVYDHNRIFLSGIKETGTVQVKWGDTEEQQCFFHYNVKNESKNNSIIKKRIDCQ
ncbi:TPA: fimbria/pilus outer membrane usher protein [Proteus mirabilis]